MASLQIKGEVWYGVFAVRGKIVWKKLGSISKAKAEKKLIILEYEHDRGNLEYFEQRKIHFDEYSIEYLEYSKVDKAKDSYLSDLNSIKRLRKHFTNQMLNHIKNTDIEYYKRERVKDAVSPRTINMELQCLFHMFNKAIDWGYLYKSPAIG